jgi:hypothetical protein
MEPVKEQKIELEVKESSLNKFLKISMIILTLIVVGFGGFLYVSSMQKNKTANNQQNKNSIVSITPTPTLEPDPGVIDIGSVDADLESIGKDVESLQ